MTEGLKSNINDIPNQEPEILDMDTNSVNNESEIEATTEKLKDTLLGLQIEISDEEKIRFDESEIRALLKIKNNLLHYIPEDLAGIIPERFKGTIDLLGISATDWKEAILKMPNLMYSLPETTNTNIEDTSQILGLEKNQFLAAALKRPQLFTNKPETINNNIEGTARLIGTEKKQFIAAALKHPQLFYQSPQTINDNVEESSKLIGMEKSQFIDVALRKPTLFSRSPESLAGNFRTLTLLFNDDPVRTREAIVKMPAILTQSQERDFLYWIAREITGKKKRDMITNPIEIIKKYFKNAGEEEGFARLERILNAFVEESQKDRKNNP